MGYDGHITIDTKVDEKGAAKGLQKISGIAKSALTGMTAIIGGASAALADGAVAGVKYNAQMEQYMTSFTTMLGSADKAQGLISDLKKFAADTPFEMTDLAKGSQTLLSFGVAADDLMPTLKMLGDVSQGNTERFDSLSLAFGQVSSAGKLSGQDLLQFINAGFNPLNEIAKKTGESMGDLRERMSNGGVSAQEVAEAFKSATSEGGQFYNAMESQSKTFNGQLSTLKDNVSAFVGELTQGLTNRLKDTALPMVNGWLDQLKTAFDAGGYPALVESFGGVLSQAVTAVAQQAPGVIQSASGVIKSFVQGIRDNLPQLATAAINIAKALATGLLDLLPGEIAEPCKQAIDGIAKSLTSGGLNNAIKDVMNVIGNLTKVLGGIAKTVLPVFAGALDFVGRNFKILLPLTLSFVAAAKTMSAVKSVQTWMKGLSKAIDAATKSANKQTVATTKQTLSQAKGTTATAASTTALVAKQTVLGLLTGKLKVAQAAQTAFNSVVAAAGGPVGLAITALGMLVTALSGFCLASDSGSDANQEFTDSLNQTRDAMNDANKSKQLGIEAADKERDSTQSLYNELRTLVNENGHVKEGYEDRVNFINGKLNEALGTQLSLEDGIEQNYIDQQDEIQKLIDKRWALAKMDALSEQASDAQQNIGGEAEKAYDKDQEIKAKREELDKLNQKRWSTYGNVSPWETKNTDDAIKKVQSELGELTRQKQELQKNVDDYQAIIDKYDQAMGAEASQDYNLLNQITSQMSPSTIREKMNSAMYEMSNAFVSALAQKAPEAQAAVLDLLGKIQDGAQAGSEELKTLFSSLGLNPPDAFLAALASKSPQVQAGTIDMLTQLQTGVKLQDGELATLLGNVGVHMSDTLVNTLQTKASPEAQAAAVQMLGAIQNGTQAGADQLAEYFKAIGADSISAPLVDAIAKQAPNVQMGTLDLLTQISQGTELKKGELETLLKNCGIDCADQLAKSLEGKSKETKIKAIELLTQLQTATDEQRPGLIQQYKDLGLALPNGLNTNLGSKNGQILATATGVVSAATAPLQTPTLSQAGLTAGQTLVSGLSSGMSGSVLLVDQAGDMVVQTAQGKLLNANLDQTGLSIGGEYAGGLADGMLSQLGYVDENGNLIAGSAEGALTGAGLPGTATGVGGKTGAGLASGLASRLYDVVQKVSAMSSTITTGLSSSAFPSHTWGNDLMTGFAKGIGAGAELVKLGIRSVADFIKGLLHFSRPDFGPLRNYEHWMPDMMQGLANGIKKNTPVITKAIERMTDKMRATLLPREIALPVGMNLPNVNSSAAVAAMQSAVANHQARIASRVNADVAAKIAVQVNTNGIQDAVRRGMEGARVEADGRQIGKVVMANWDRTVRTYGR